MEAITYEWNGQWGGYKLQSRHDGLWKLESWSRIQGATTGRVVILEAPPGLDIKDTADLATVYTVGGHNKADYLIEMSREVRCLKRGIEVK